MDVKVGEITKRTPFYMGLIAFEEEFLGLENYVHGFIKDLTEIQKKIICYIAIVHYYTNRSIPAHFFSKMLRVIGSQNLIKSFRLDDFLPVNIHLDSLLIQEKEKDSDIVYWKPRHHLLSKEIIIQVLSGKIRDTNVWVQNLGDYAISFIREIKVEGSVPSDELLSILRDLFITRDKNEITTERFSKIIIEILEGSLGTDSAGLIYNELVEQYPDESHFWGHLARYYSNISEDIEKALNCADKAIKLSTQKDPLLYHIKGICYKREVTVLSKKVVKIINEEPNSDIHDLMTLLKQKVSEAAEQFAITRELDSEMHGYISHIQMLIDIIDMGYKLSGCSLYAEFLRTTTDPWYSQCLDDANNLYDEVRNLHIDRERDFLSDIEKRILKLYDNYGKVLELWNNQLNKDEQNKEMIRRQIVRATVYQAGSFSTVHPDKLAKLAEMMEENIRNEPRETINIEMWFQIARNLPNLSIDAALNKMSRWVANSDSIVSLYYYYILKVLKGLEGSSAAIIEANELIKQCSSKAFNHPNRAKEFEWLGEGRGLSKLVNYKSLNTKGLEDFRGNLPKLEGKFIKWEHDGAGVIDHNGLKVFFRPSQGNGGKSITKNDEGKKVLFSLGFSYDKLRAFDQSVVTEKYLIANSGNKNDRTYPPIETRRRIFTDDVVDCEVTKITKFFANVKVNGVQEQCSIHISQLSNRYIATIDEVIKVGDKLQAKVIKFDERHGYQLSCKDVVKNFQGGSPTVFAEQLKKWKIKKDEI